MSESEKHIHTEGPVWEEFLVAAWGSGACSGPSQTGYFPHFHFPSMTPDQVYFCVHLSLTSLFEQLGEDACGPQHEATVRAGAIFGARGAWLCFSSWAEGLVGESDGAAPLDGGNFLVLWFLVHVRTQQTGM